jgi:hypothetical protein
LGSRDVVRLGFPLIKIEKPRPTAVAAKKRI